jgi:hypothetical protein
MNERRQKLLLSGACVLALVALALIVWSIVDPRPMPVVISMSIAQGLGTLSLLVYLGVVLADLVRARVLGRDERKARDEEKPS